MQVFQFLKKIFIEGYWECRYRSVDEDGRLPNPTGSWTGKLVVPKRYWCADPFLVQENGKTYVFVELMDRYHSYGLLGYAEIKNAHEDAEVRLLKDLGFHASYPNVFKYNDQWYMIPETSANSTIELYWTATFPDNWEKVAVLMDNIKAVDTTVFTLNGKLYIFIYQSFGDDNQLDIAELDPEKGCISNYKNCKKYHNKIGRPGGDVIYTNSGIIRPTQYGVNRYGEKLVFKQFSYCPEYNNYTETDVLELCNTDFLDCSDFIGLHTYGRISGLEIIDLYKKRFYIFRPLMLICKKLRLFDYK